MLMCCVLLPLAACRQAPSEAATQAAMERTAGSKAAADGDVHKLTVRTGQGRMTLSGGNDMALPEAFPEDIYLPEGYRVRQVISMASATVVTVSVADGTASLMADAGAAMRERGWKQAASSGNANGAGLLIFEKDRRRAAMTFSTRGTADERVIQVQLTDKR
ncbi:hypothetical protein CSC75_13190 [Pseudoxanthomonas wuyuanensis]|nr:hypothetical protein CSC75_13190 [Pseudoxanthomonas wuyuanensis]